MSDYFNAIAIILGAALPKLLFIGAIYVLSRIIKNIFG